VEEKGKFKVNNVFKNGGKDMNLINNMQTLKDDIKSGRQKRRQDLKTIKQTTKQLQQDAHKRIAEEEKIRKEEAEAEKRKLAAFTRDLEQDVGVLRKGFRQDQKELREEILTAGEIWRGTASTKIVPEKENKKNEENEK